ncbi:anthranilate phosphoribosyltransferase [Desulfobacula phenolica]|uniref:Anthranilate phosphoribosyltransferase n=1 Tax=Desulfobacula phenolica TaxID=90732 RepID=A0A1H2DY63_9BACT|nr:anthranilate phosphoribosyltransferase [Desulfobacula phenolica]SDT87826.1 anthranilate phosphoribosyltransferase [Desulfobacula phenolica]
MSQTINREFGTIITRLIQKENLTRNEAKQAFVCVLNNTVTDMHQGAFLAALTAKGETKEEVAGSWEAIYDLDTTKVKLNHEIKTVDNSGTGMDTFKTFNISTAASIIAASGGIPMARHGARAITSVCGTVDMAEALGVDVECTADIVAKSIETAGLGLFNGMSPHIHPMALGRILSQIYFGSTLNIAASLANPALPSIGVRGVYSREMIRPVADVMQEIGYQNAIVLHGSIEDSDKGMDEASVCGITHCAQIQENKKTNEFTIDPKKLGLAVKNHTDLSPEQDIETESKRFAALINNQENSARKDAALLNAGLIFLAAGKAKDVEDGIQQATKLLEAGTAFETLENWVKAQNTDPEKGLKKLHRLMQ